MSRLIDADVMREEWLKNGENEYVYDTNAVLDSIDCQPTIDAEPVKHGEVVIVTDRWKVMHQECSVCGYRIEGGRYPHYCPNCGAKMDLEGEKHAED